MYTHHRQQSVPSTRGQVSSKGGRDRAGRERKGSGWTRNIPLPQVWDVVWDRRGQSQYRETTVLTQTPKRKAWDTMVPSTTALRILGQWRKWRKSHVGCGSLFLRTRQSRRGNATRDAPYRSGSSKRDFCVGHSFVFRNGDGRCIEGTPLLHVSTDKRTTCFPFSPSLLFY